MKAYRVWVVFRDGEVGFASSAYEKRERARAVCIDATASQLKITKEAAQQEVQAVYQVGQRFGYEAAQRRIEWNNKHRRSGIDRFEVREEEIPRDHLLHSGKTLRIRYVLFGDDQEQTDLEPDREVDP